MIKQFCSEVSMSLKFNLINENDGFFLLADLIMFINKNMLFI